MAMTLEELNKKIQEYIDHGYRKDVQEAIGFALKATQHFIARTYPKSAVDGKKLGGFDTQIRQLKKIDVSAYAIAGGVYADYFSRWYITGAYGRIIKGSGPRQGEKGPTYPSRGDFFGKNKAAIEDYYRQQLEEYLQTHISI